MTPASFPRQVAMLLWKDVRVELRAGELIYATLLFAVIIVLLFSFAFLGGSSPTVEVIWMSCWHRLTDPHPTAMCSGAKLTCLASRSFSST